MQPNAAQNKRTHHCNTNKEQQCKQAVLRVLVTGALTPYLSRASPTRSRVTRGILLASGRSETHRRMVQC
eukprot:6533475-Pyramimonas_sp.AAC.1